MNILDKGVWFDDDSMWAELSDGRIIGVPLVWFPRLLNASSVDLQNFSLSPNGIHWESLDEDISIEGLLAGRRDQTKQGNRQRERQDGTGFDTSVSL